MKYIAVLILGGVTVTANAVVVNLGVLSQFNSLAGAKLDDASTYTRAINFGGPTSPSSVNVQGILFQNSTSASDFTTDANQYENRFQPEYGPTTNDNNFELVVGSIGYTGISPVGGTFSNLAPGQYLVKTYFHEEFWSSSGTSTRKFDYSINGVNAFTGLNLGFREDNVSFVHEAVVTIGGSTLSFSAQPGSGPEDPIPTISAITLQAVPEPASIVAVGLGTIAFLKRRKIK